MPERVVSLCPSITETVVAIGGLSRLAAATRYCVRPKGLLWGLPRIGGTKTPDIGRILDLSPDLVLANEEENRREDVEALRARGIEVDVTFPKRVADVPAIVRHWGRLLSGESVAEADALASRIEALIGELEHAPAARPFRFAYWIWKDPWMTVSDDTYVADLLRLAGGVNAYGDSPSRYPTTSPNEALARSVEIQFFPSEPYPFRAEKHRSLAEKAFGTEAEFRFVEGDSYCWHGARTLDGLSEMALLRRNLNEIR
ncbi:MAG TPA: helical backbone metal receptor [Thermoanaerobaculia bacterium]